MDVLLIIVVLLLLAGVFSAMHAFIAPAVDWLSPPLARSAAPISDASPAIQHLRERKRQRLEMLRTLSR